MRFTQMLIRGVLFGVVTAGASSPGLARQAPPAQAGSPAAAGPVTVPEGDGAPVITDGRFSPGEWDDALRIGLNEAVELRLKQYRGVVFLGLRGPAPTGLGPSELFLATPGEPIHLLHVSAQLGEVVLPPTGETPAFRFGLTSDWYANEQRRDMPEADRLEREGRDPFTIIRATTYPADGIEFAIRRTKFPGSRWLLRLTTSYFNGDRPGWLAYPAAAAEQTTDGWLQLDFAPAGSAAGAGRKEARP